MATPRSHFDHEIFKDLREAVVVATAGPLDDDDRRKLVEQGLVPDPADPEYPATAAIHYSLLSSVPDPLVLPLSRILPKPPPRLLTTTDGGPCILDPRAYSGVVDRVIAHLDYRPRIALWGTCFALYTHVSAHLYRHVVFGSEPGTIDSELGTVDSELGSVDSELRTVDGNKLPFKFKHRLHQLSELVDGLGRYTRIFDFPQWATEPAAFAFVQPLCRARIVRVCAFLDFTAFPPIPSPTAVVSASCVPHTFQDWTRCLALLPHGLPAARRLVINVAYVWPQQLFVAHLGKDSSFPQIPNCVDEVVFHFKQVGERARYLRWFAQPYFYEDDSGYVLTIHHQLREALTSAAPPPVLGPMENIELVRPLKPVGQDLFQGLAELYANAVGRGKRVRRTPRLTLVGLEEFDAARDADAADDAAFARVVGDLPWRGPVPDANQYQHRPYEPVAPTFVERILRLVHSNKHERVRRSVQLLSCAEYLAGLNHPADEDWWDTPGQWEWCSELQFLQGMERR